MVLLLAPRTREDQDNHKSRTAVQLQAFDEHILTLKTHMKGS